MNQIIYSSLVIIILAMYAVLLYKKTSKDRDSKTMAWAFGLVFTAGFLMHLIIYTRTALSRQSLYDIITLIFYSAQHSLKMFLGSSPIYRMLTDINDIPALYYLFVPVFYMAVITSAFFIFNFISRKLYTRRWLGKSHNHAVADKGGNSIFLGVNKFSNILAENLRKEMREKGKEGMILFVELPDENEQVVRLSLWDVLRQFLTARRKRQNAPYDILLKVSDNMKGLLKWLENPMNDVYILSEDIQKNVQLVERLMEHPLIRCHVYCHARKEGLIAKYDSVADLNNQLTIIDSSMLAVEGLKSNPILHPVNYVDVGKINGRNAGWVTDKGFTSAILGFGETGKESLSFLYEFGAFPDKNMNKAPFKCYVFDNNMEKASSEFIRKTPAMNLSEIIFLQDGINTPNYWRTMKSIINELNYLVISLGDDKLSLNTAIDIAEYAVRYRKSDDPDDNLKNFAILFRLSDPEKIDLITLSSANAVFGNILKPFGRINDIWKYDIISRNSLEQKAEKFYISYETLAGSKPLISWKDKLDSRYKGTYRDRCKAQRHVAQNYSNCLHMETKKLICDEYYHHFAANIASPSDFDGQNHYTGNDKEAGMIMEYLAVGEKLRWNASHEILGYIKGNETNDQLKTHKFICGYDELDENVKHYDWLVVRNSLLMNL